MWNTALKNINRVSVEFKMYQDNLYNKYFYWKASKTFLQVEINKVLHESGIEDRHLVAVFETACSEGSRFERVASQNFLNICQIS